MQYETFSPSLADPHAVDEPSFDRAIAKLRQYSQLQDDWDEDGSQRPSEQAIDYAERLLTCLRAKPCLTAPFVAPIDGGVYIEWRINYSSLYLEIDASSVLTVRRESGAVKLSTETSHSNLDAATALVEQFHNNHVK
jgi:hypothetical protein